MDQGDCGTGRGKWFSNVGANNVRERTCGWRQSRPKPQLAPRAANWRRRCTHCVPHTGKSQLQAVEIDGTRPEIQCWRDKYRRTDRDKAVCSVFGSAGNLGHGHPNVLLTHVGSQQKNVKRCHIRWKTNKTLWCELGNWYKISFYLPCLICCQSLFSDLYSFIQKEWHFVEWV